MSARGYSRTPASVVRNNGRLVLVVPGRPPITVSGSEAEIIADILSSLGEAVESDVLEQRVDRETLRGLVKAGVLHEGPMSEAAPSSHDTRPCQHLVIGIAGSIAAMNAPAWGLPFARHFARDVDVVFTRAATRFVRPEGLAHYGLRTWTSATQIRPGIHVPHIQLASQASLVLVLFATAHTVFRLAHGAANDLLSLIVSATRAPVVVVPAMNDAMWQHPPVQRNVAQLRHDGVFVADPLMGHAASDGVAGSEPHRGWGTTPEGLEQALRAILGGQAKTDRPRRRSRPR